MGMRENTATRTDRGRKKDLPVALVGNYVFRWRAKGSKKVLIDGSVPPFIIIRYRCTRETCRDETELWKDLLVKNMYLLNSYLAFVPDLHCLVMLKVS